MDRPQVVITGLGAVSPLGLSTEALWEGLVEGRCGISQISATDPTGSLCPLAGRVPAYKITDFIPKTSRKAAKLMSRDIELAVIAADQAVRQSGWVTRGVDPDHVTIRPERAAVNLGAGLISCDLEELAPAVAASTVDGRFDLHRWGREGMSLVTPLWLLKYLPNMLACHVSIIHDLQGPSNSITCAEVSSHLAIIEAKQILERGDADISLAGGAETKVNPQVLLTQRLLKRTTDNGEDHSEAACRPFDAEARGSAYGEGAGVLILENARTAQDRGAKVLAVIAGTGHSCSLNPQYQSLEPDGLGLRMAIEKALAEARIGPDELDLVIPHGTGILDDDLAEARGIEAALGPAVEKVPVWPIKGLLSNTGAASGSLDLIAAVCAMRNQMIPAVRTFGQKAPGCPLHIVTTPLHAPIHYALCCGYTYGGLTAAIVLKNPDQD